MANFIIRKYISTVLFACFQHIKIFESDGGLRDFTLPFLSPLPKTEIESLN